MKRFTILGSQFDFPIGFFFLNTINATFNFLFFTNFTEYQITKPALNECLNFVRRIQHFFLMFCSSIQISGTHSTVALSFWLSFLHLKCTACFVRVLPLCWFRVIIAFSLALGTGMERPQGCACFAPETGWLGNLTRVWFKRTAYEEKKP